MKTKERWYDLPVIDYADYNDAYSYWYDSSVNEIVSRIKKDGFVTGGPIATRKDISTCESIMKRRRCNQTFKSLNGKVRNKCVDPKTGDPYYKVMYKDIRVTLELGDDTFIHIPDAYEYIISELCIYVSVIHHPYSHQLFICVHPCSAEDPSIYISNISYLTVVEYATDRRVSMAGILEDNISIYITDSIILYRWGDQPMFKRVDTNWLYPDGNTSPSLKYINVLGVWNSRVVDVNVDEN